MKRIFFFANYTPDDRSIGITKKISSEITTLRKLGYCVYYSAYKNEGVVICNDNDEVVFRKKYISENSKIKKITRYFLLQKTAVDFLKNDSNFDIGYIRIGPPNKLLFKILRLLKDSGAKIIAESLAYFPGMKFDTLSGKYTKLLFRINQKKFPKYLEYFLSEGTFESLFGVKAYMMNMGVDTDKFSEHNYCGNPDELNIISVSNERTYHAYDRIIRGMCDYYKNNPDKIVNLHLVGVVSDKTKELIEKCNLNKYVFLYGKKYGDELEEIYNKCNLGLGPLGQHRMGGKKDTGLKTKEYFAKGLPYVYSGEEPSVEGNYPFIFNVPSDESPIDINALFKFYLSYKDNKDTVKQMRRFAIDTYSWENIMSEALSHLDK